jgi:hypothetical protein
MYDFSYTMSKGYLKSDLFHPIRLVCLIRIFRDAPIGASVRMIHLLWGDETCRKARLYKGIGILCEFD